MAVSYWRVFTDTKNPDVARRLAAKLQSRTDRDFREIHVNEYHKGGHLLTFNIEHNLDEWSATVFDVITCAQQIGHGWSISGAIDEELDLIATGSSILGVKLVTCFCPRPETPNAK